MSQLKNCNFCTHLKWDKEAQYGRCDERSIYITDTEWSGKHCSMYKIDEDLDPAKMVQLIKCIDCGNFPEGQRTTGYCRKWTAVKIVNPIKERTCRGYKKRETSEYVRINWNTHHGSLHEMKTPIAYSREAYVNTSNAVEEINKHTMKNKFTAFRDAPFGVVTYGSEEKTLIEDEEIKMNENIEKKLKDKQDKINKIIKVRKEYIKSWMNKFEELDYDIRRNYLLKYSELRSEFRKYILNNVAKKTKKGLNKVLKYVLIEFSTGSILYGKRYKTIKAHLLCGEKWNFLKKILAIISKYASLYANEKLKGEYSNLSSKYDVILYDDETLICEACGTENQLIALYCNSCGKKL